MAHEKNVGKHSGLGYDHSKSFPGSKHGGHSRKTVRDTQGTAMKGAKHSRGAKIH